ASASFSSDGKTIVTTDAKGMVRFWDATTGAAIADSEEHQSERCADSLTRSSTPFALDASSKAATTSGVPVGSRIGIRPGVEAKSVRAQSPDGARVVTASEINTARLQDSASGAEVALIGHSAWINSADFSRDGARVVTASKDGTARVWDAASGAALAVLRG